MWHLWGRISSHGGEREVAVEKAKQTRNAVMKRHETQLQYFFHDNTTDI